jgi:hypothetical protein
LNDLKFVNDLNRFVQIVPVVQAVQIVGSNRKI